MQFIYPYYNATINLTKQLDGSQGKTIFELTHQELSPTKGKHRVTVVDEEGNALGVGVRGVIRMVYL